MKHTFRFGLVIAGVAAAILCVAPLTTLASDSQAKDQKTSYVLIKGGMYSPSRPFDLNDIDFDIGGQTGFSGEIAFGEYLMPMLAIELGAGYFQSKNSPAVPANDTLLQVVPLVATAKLFVPMGSFEPYVSGGIGAYITDIDVRGDTSSFSGTTEITYGLHGGIGFNINFDTGAFVGLEEKYIWAEPEFDGRHVNIDGFITNLVFGTKF